MAPAKSAVRRAVVVGLIVAAAISGAAVATASETDTGILNQTQVPDATGDSGGGPDLSSLTVTTYADGTASFSVQFANRKFLQPGETVQIFLDLNGDGTADVNLSIWPSFDPSYLDRRSGSDWTDIRQLSELVQSDGSFSVRLSLSELRSAGAVPIGAFINVAVGSWTADSSGELPTTADDWLPSATAWARHAVAQPVGTTTAAATTTTAAPTGSPSPHTVTPSSTHKTAGAVTIERLAPLSGKIGHDLTVHVILDRPSSLTGRFKVCIQLPNGIGAYPQQCRSTVEAAGARGPVSFSFSVRVTPAAAVGTTHIGVIGSGGGSTAKAIAVLHVAKL